MEEESPGFTLNSISDVITKIPSIKFGLSYSQKGQTSIPFYSVAL
ncbi:hypothetical protein SAMN05421766_103611 [Zobellia uliginosa]|uniref:Uncharacterized protein n=1 Tax=Zobellia uliginosa TaxID=143224 RepID=A0ABY1KSZ8_9FLAO|nr:hypothetical protein SAMN05421766_103611 [Zobellia uliginosa]